MTRATKVILLISAIHCFSLWAGEPKSAATARYGIELAYNMQLDEAERIFDGLIAENPDDPQGYGLKSVVYYYRYLLDESTAEIEKQFIKLAKTGIDRAHKRLARTRNDVDALFYAGTAHIYLAALHGEQGNWLRAFWNGKEGIQYLKRTVEIDSTYYDAYFGLGVYHYYADVMPKLVKSVTGLIGIEADRERGLNELKMVMAKGAFAKAEAAYFLGKIYAEMEKDREKARACFEVLSGWYPQNPGFLLDLGENQWRVRNEGSYDVLMAPAKLFR
jgi:tetratricopeptide (TPR) repeat protein